MAEFRYTIDANDNSSSKINQLTNRINELKATLNSIGAQNQWSAALQNNLREVEAELIKLQQGAARTGSAIRDIAKDSGFLSRRLQQDLGAAVDSINQLNVSAVQGMLNASKEGQSQVERQAQRNRAIAASNQAEIERITNRPMILGDSTNIQRITAATSMFATLGENVDRVDTKGRRMATTWGLNRIGMLEMEAAGVNTFQALAAGMDPFHVVLMESSQVMGALVQGGLIPSTSIISGLMSPLGAAVAGFVALSAALAFVIFRSQETQTNINNIRGSLLTTGDSAKLSETEILKWMDSLKELGAGRGEILDLTAAFGPLEAKSAGAGRALSVVALTQARMKGSKLDDEIKTLTTAISGGTDGLAKYAAGLKGGTEAQRQFLITLGERGSLDSAKNALADLIVEANKLPEALVRGQKAWLDFALTQGAAGGMNMFPGPQSGMPTAPTSPQDLPGGNRFIGKDFLSEISKNNADLGHLNEEFKRRLNEWLGTLSEAERASLRIGPRGAFATSGHAEDSSHYKGVAIDIGGMSGSAAAKLKAAKLAQNVEGDWPHIEPSEIPWTNPGISGASGAARQMAARNFAATGGQRESDEQAQITRQALDRQKIEKSIGDTVAQIANFRAAAELATTDQDRERNRLAAENAEIQLRSIHTPEQEQAHQLRMANLEVEMRKAEEAANRDRTLRQGVTDVQKRMAAEINTYMQGAATAARGFTEKETSETIAATERIRVAKLNEAKGSLEGQLQANALRRAAIGNDAQAQITAAEQKKQMLVSSGVAEQRALDDIDQEIVRLRVTANQQSFQDFMQAKQNEIREAKGSATQINAIIEEMRAKAAATYANMPRDYKRAMEEIERIQIDATARSVQARITEANRSSQIDQIKISEEKRRLDQAVINRTITQQQALQQEASIVRQKAQIEEESLNKILNDTKTNAEQRKTIEFDLLQLKERTAQRLEDINKRTAEANERDLKKNAEDYKQFFSSIGSAASSYLEAAILKTSTFADANRALLRGVGRAALNLVGDVASKTIAGKLGGKPGEGISDVLSRMLMTSLGLNSAATTANTAATTAGAATSTASAAANTANTAASVANTGSQITNTATNTVATAVNTGALAVNTASQQVQTATNVIPFFARGGIVPSAAGGMIVGGGGTLSILHPREMVLPENISKGMQNMIEHGSTSNSAVVNYNANVTGYHPYSSRASFEGLLRQHGNAMLSHVNNAVRNGWRG